MLVLLLAAAVLFLRGLERQQYIALVTADGEHLDCSATENAEAFQLGRVGLGCLGILTYVDMTIVPAFQLRAV